MHTKTYEYISTKKHLQDALAGLLASFRIGGHFHDIDMVHDFEGGVEAGLARALVDALRVAVPVVAGHAYKVARPQLYLPAILRLVLLYSNLLNKSQNGFRSIIHVLLTVISINFFPLFDFLAVPCLVSPADRIKSYNCFELNKPLHITWI